MNNFEIPWLYAGLKDAKFEIPIGHINLTKNISNVSFKLFIVDKNFIVFYTVNSSFDKATLKLGFDLEC